MISEVCHYLNMTKKELCLKGRVFTNILKKKQQRELFNVCECTAQRTLSEAGVEMDRKSWERRHSETGLYETKINRLIQLKERKQQKSWRIELENRTESTKNITQEVVKK